MTTPIFYTNISNSTFIITASSNNSIVNKIDVETNKDSTSTLIFVQFLFLIILLLATITGNALVLYLIGKHLKCTSFTNSFISSMSLSDLVGLLCCAPLTLTTIVKQSWIMGNISCVFNSLMNNAFGMASTYMLTCIVVDRYLVIAKVPRSETTTKIAHGAIGTSWIMAIILSIPWHIILQDNSSKELHKPGFVHCTYVFHIVHSNEGTIHSIILIVIGYILPVAVMVLCCVRIWNVLHKTDTRVQPASLAPTQLRLAGSSRLPKQY